MVKKMGLEKKNWKFFLYKIYFIRIFSVSIVQIIQTLLKSTLIRVSKVMYVERFVTVYQLRSNNFIFPF